MSGFGWRAVWAAIAGVALLSPVFSPGLAGAEPAAPGVVQDAAEKQDAAGRTDAAAQETVFFERLNAHRRSMGRPEVSVDPALRAAAQNHVEAMVRSGVFSHQGADGSDFAERARRAGFDGFARGENIGRGYADAGVAFESWLASPAHRGNMELAASTRAGLGMAVGADGRTLWWTLVLGQPR